MIEINELSVEAYNAAALSLQNDVKESHEEVVEREATLARYLAYVNSLLFNLTGVSL